MTLRTATPYLARAVPPDEHILNNATTYNESLIGFGERQTPKYLTLREAWTDKDGSFSLGEHHAGKYSISVSGLDGQGDIEVEIVTPEKWQDDSVAIELYEGCQRARAVPVSVHDSELHSK